MKTESTEVKLWTTNQVVLATLFVVCVFLSFWLLYRFRVVVFMFFIAVVIGTTIRPAVEWFHRRGLSRPVAIIAIYVLIAGFLAGFLALVVPLIVDQATQISQKLPLYQREFRRALLDSNNLLLRNIAIRIPSEFNFLASGNPTAEEVFDQVTQTFRYANFVVNGVLSILVIFLLAYYWTQESNFIIRNILRLIPRPRRRKVREFVQLVEVKIGGYVRGQGILSLVVGLAAFVSYILIGLPYSMVLAIIAGIMEMVPIFGPALGAIPALLVAISIGQGKAIWVLVATAIIQLAENVFLVPRIMNHSMGVNPIVILLSLVTFSAVFGFPGALLALPLAAIIQLLVERIIASANENREPLTPREKDMQLLLNKSQTLKKTIQSETCEENSTFQKLPEQARNELLSISEEVENFLRKLKEKEEAA